MKVDLRRPPTPKQAKAIEYLHEHPDATVWQICNHAFVSEAFSNRAEFIVRLIESGHFRLAVNYPRKEHA